MYIREAHPTDEWQMPVNEKESILFEQPKTAKRRQEIAGTCCSRLKLTMPCAVDSIDNKVDELYAAWPERIFIVDKDGRISYAGGQGPFGFDPGEAEAWLRKNVGSPGGAAGAAP